MCRVELVDLRLFTGEERETIQDEQIIERVLRGDQDAFRLLVRNYGTYIYQIVYSVVKHPADAEDVTQETFLQLHRSLPHYENKGFKTWISRIAVNKAIDFNRKRQRFKEDATERIDTILLHTEQGMPDEPDFLKKEWQSLIRDRLEQVPANYKEMIQDYYFHEKSYQQIANERNISVKTVESKLYRAKQWIRNRWKEDEFR